MLAKAKAVGRFELLKSTNKIEHPLMWDIIAIAAIAYIGLCGLTAAVLRGFYGGSLLAFFSRCLMHSPLPSILREAKRFGNASRKRNRQNVEENSEDE